MPTLRGAIYPRTIRALSSDWARSRVSEGLKYAGPVGPFRLLPSRRSTGIWLSMNRRRVEEAHLFARGFSRATIPEITRSNTKYVFEKVSPHRAASVPGSASPADVICGRYVCACPDAT